MTVYNRALSHEEVEAIYDETRVAIMENKWPVTRYSRETLYGDPVAPITASYDLADGTPVFTEPRQVGWTETEMRLNFRFHHAGPSRTLDVVELQINGVRRVYPLGHTTTLSNGDYLDCVISLPYE